MTEIVVRVATSDDLDLLSGLIAASYATLDDGSYDRGNLAAAMPAISKANPKLLASGTYFVAEIDGEPAGCGGWTVDKPGSGAELEQDLSDPHFDADSDPTKPRWYMVDVQLQRKFRSAITLATLREHENRALKGLALLQRGNRLSVTPVSAAQWQFILSIAS